MASTPFNEYLQPAHLESDADKPACVVCFSHGRVLRCSGCEMTFYCAHDSCQKQHWKAGGHKGTCKKLKAALEKDAQRQREGFKDTRIRFITGGVTSQKYDFPSGLADWAASHMRTFFCIMALINSKPQVPGKVRHLQTFITVRGNLRDPIGSPFSIKEVRHSCNTLEEDFRSELEPWGHPESIIKDYIQMFTQEKLDKHMLYLLPESIKEYKEGQPYLKINLPRKELDKAKPLTGGLKMDALVQLVNMNVRSLRSVLTVVAPDLAKLVYSIPLKDIWTSLDTQWQREDMPVGILI